MLNYLKIKNLALIANAEVEFAAGFNAVTGESGSGKTVLLNTIALLTGKRADKNLLRNGCSRCELSAEITVDAERNPEIVAALEEAGIELENSGKIPLQLHLIPDGVEHPANQLQNGGIPHIHRKNEEGFSGFFAYFLLFQGESPLFVHRLAGKGGDAVEEDYTTAIFMEDQFPCHIRPYLARAQIRIAPEANALLVEIGQNIFHRGIAVIVLVADKQKFVVYQFFPGIVVSHRQNPPFFSIVIHHPFYNIPLQMSIVTTFPQFFTFSCIFRES